MSKALKIGTRAHDYVLNECIVDFIGNIDECHEYITKHESEDDANNLVEAIYQSMGRPSSDVKFYVVMVVVSVEDDIADDSLAIYPVEYNYEVNWGLEETK